MAGETPAGSGQTWPGFEPSAQEQSELFERNYMDVLPDMTDMEVLMLGVGMSLLRAEAKSIMPEQRYSLAIAKLATELHIRAMRRF